MGVPSDNLRTHPKGGDDSGKPEAPDLDSIADADTAKGRKTVECCTVRASSSGTSAVDEDVIAKAMGNGVDDGLSHVDLSGE